MSSTAAISREDFEAPGQGQRTALVRRYNVARSCIRCHERKVRCNKAMPCSPCNRAKAQCRYPGPEKAKRRAHRDTQAEVGPRLERLERALGAIATIPERARSEPEEARGQRLRNRDMVSISSPLRTRSPSPTRRGQDAPLENHTARGLLVKNGTSTRYINEAMLSQMLEKETELQSAISTPDSRVTYERGPPSFGLRGLISNPAFYLTDHLALHPSRGQAVRLWQTYLNNVNPLMRLLHIPTTQPAIFAAINDPTHVSADFNALLFSIYFASVTSLDDSEVQLILGEDRESAVNLYQQGLEINLHASFFLDSPTVTSLQAMSIFLMCRRNHSSGISGWVLNGLLTRAAQSVGLHRDGENFKLSPFDCEIRRRLWWQVSSIEGRVAEDHGIFTGELLNFCDTKFPSNLNDDDLTVDMKHAPEPRVGWADTTSYLVVFETNRALHKMNHLQAHRPPNNETLAELEDFLQSFKEELQNKYLLHLDPNIPIQKYCLCLGHVQLGKLEVLIRQQSLKGVTVDRAAEFAYDDTLLIACEAVEKGTHMRTDELMSHFHWLTSSFPQYFLLTYCLWHLCVRPDSESADRAWNAIEASFEKDQPRHKVGRSPKWNVLTKLREKALSIRHSYLSRKNARADLPHLDGQEVATEKLDEDIFNMAMQEGMMWDLDFSLISGFQVFPSDTVMQNRTFGQ